MSIDSAGRIPKRRNSDRADPREACRGAAMTRQQRALACAIGFAPATAAGIVLMRCGCATAAWALEVLTAAAYLVWIFLPRR
jgi:hypothetical protein